MQLKALTGSHHRLASSISVSNLY